MDDGTTRANPWQAVCEAMVTHVLRALQVIYDDFNVSLERWLNDMVSHPIAANWRDEVMAFVDATERKGLRILPDSIRVIETLIESRIAGTGQFAQCGPARRAPAKTVLLAQPVGSTAPQAAARPANAKPPAPIVGYPDIPTGHRGPPVNAERLFDGKVASAKQHFAVLDQLLKVVSEKIEAAKPGEEVDLEYEAAMTKKHLFLFNEDRAVARDLWLRFNLSSDANSRLIEMPLPASLGLPNYAYPAQAERALQQTAAVGRRLNSQNASMDAWVTGIAATETAATAVGIVAGAGVLVVAAKKGGTWAVVKVAAAGAAAIAADTVADAGLRAAGASEQTIGGVRLAAAVITLILLHKATKRVPSQEPKKIIGGATPADQLPPEPRKGGDATPTPAEPAGHPPQSPRSQAPTKPSDSRPSKPPFPPPQSESRHSWPGHRTGAEAEEALARTVHGDPDQVVLRWGDPIGSHGADVVSVNIKTGEVTFWDSKYRSGSVRIQPSETFQNPRALAKAIRKAEEAIKANTTLPADIRAAALQNLEKRQVRTRTVGAGNARNSTLK